MKAKLFICHHIHQKHQTFHYQRSFFHSNYLFFAFVLFHFHIVNITKAISPAIIISTISILTQNLLASIIPEFVAIKFDANVIISASLIIKFPHQLSTTKFSTKNYFQIYSFIIISTIPLIYFSTLPLKPSFFPPKLFLFTCSRVLFF